MSGNSEGRLLGGGAAEGHGIPKAMQTGLWWVTGCRSMRADVTVVELGRCAGAKDFSLTWKEVQARQQAGQRSGTLTPEARRRLLSSFPAGPALPGGVQGQTPESPKRCQLLTCVPSRRRW